MIQSPVFWGCLIASVAVFWSLPVSIRYGFLALTSYAYLATLEPVVVTWFVIIALVVYATTHLASRHAAARPWVVPMLVVWLIGYLVYHKYDVQLRSLLPFLSDNPAVPLGLSYFSFKLAHYVIEVSRGTIVDRSLSRFLSYVLLFPIFTAGPIERYDHFLANRDEHWQPESAAYGATRIAYGLIKKFVVLQLLFPEFRAVLVGPDIADARTLVASLDSMATHRVWAFLFCEFLYTYLDFSAYSDIAIGAARLYGIRILENFNLPILATNISEFWKRWHMTLAGWCQRYVYLPVMGLTRQPRVAVYATFVVMGLWHGGGAVSWRSWVLWGLYHATGVTLYLTWSRLKRNRGWGVGAPGWKHYAIGLPATVAFVSGSYAFSSTAAIGAKYGLRVFAKLFGVTF